MGDDGIAALLGVVGAAAETTAEGDGDDRRELDNPLMGPGNTATR